MGKKGIVASAVRVAVSAAEKAIAPSPLAKQVIAAAAAEAVRQVERRAPEILAPIEKRLRKNAGELAKPVDKALAKKPKSGSKKKKKSVRTSAAAKRTSAKRGKKSSTKKKRR